MSSPLTKAQGGRYLERKVLISWDGGQRTMMRWLSQVVAYCEKRRALGEPGPFRWRMHVGAPWHEVKFD